MAGLEASALKLGGTIASHAFKSWLRRRKDKDERTADLATLAADEVSSPLERQKLENLIATVGTQVAEQLTPVLTTRFPELPRNEITAAFLALEDTLGQIDLSDTALLADDADPERLARRVREQFPGRPVGLSERAGSLYELALDQSCRHLVLVVRHLPSFQPRALSEVLGRLSRQSDQLDEVLARLPSTPFRVLGRDVDAAFREDYLSLLARKLDHLELLGLTMDDQPRLPLTVAYLSLTVSDGSATLRAEAAIGAADRTLIRGEAGSGKTTLVDWLSVTAARGAFTGELAAWNGFVPFPIRLRSFATEPLPRPDDFLAHIAPGLAAQMPPLWATRMLLKGTALVLVDGVDEVDASRRYDVKAWLRDLNLTFPQAKFVITSRTAAADRRWLRKEGYASVVLQPMTIVDIKLLVERWHLAAAAGKSPRPKVDLAAAERRLLGQLESRVHLRSLAASPLLCAVLCALNLAHRAELPSDRMDLYRKALSMLLHLRDTERRVPVLLSEAQKTSLLGDLAWRLTLANKVEFDVDKVREHLERRLRSLPYVDKSVDEVLNDLLERSGLLRRPAASQVDFVHRTFQEFLAAGEATEQNHIDTLIGHAHLDTWRETVVLAGGQAKQHQAEELLNGILDRANTEPDYARYLRLVAASCLETVRDIAPETLARVERTITEHLVPPPHFRAASSLVSLGSRLLRYLPESVEALPEESAAATVRAASLTTSDDALPLLRRYAKDSRAQVQTQLEKAWQFFDPDRFATEVMADSPLQEGSFIITTSRLLPYLRHLRHLTGLGITLSGTERHQDLGVLAGAPALFMTRLKFDERTEIDLTPLTEHPRLRMISLHNAARYTEVAALTGLDQLSNLRLDRVTPWTRPDVLGDLTGLSRLSLNMIGRLDFLSRLPNLKHLFLSEAGPMALRKRSPLENVEEFTLENPAGRMAVAQETAAAFPAVTDLRFRGATLDTLRPLAGLPLTNLELDYCTIGSLAPLAEISTLKRVVIRFPQAEVDVRPLADRILTLRLRDTTAVIGVDRLGAGVKLELLGAPSPTR
ncbi:NACHT domain-containing protein [Amycolatopsis xylanica]|uniref:NACHT domain-containing protein n=1 Tax=Amycolatopsis xylanica TaxID=589385 RepID=A0A1H3DH15_9PSEU|nr:NACHT domain-containing protein [Amycolatopsis xylanica]SDX65705.1 NACHT domain-containing protein [Amycolatopsis xylanica]